MQAVGYFLGDVGGDFLHVRIALQVRARHVQRYVWRVNDTVQQSQEVGDDAFHRVGHVHLVAVELYFIPLQLDVALDLREIQYPCQVERVIHIQVYPKERFVRHGIKVAVELLVVFVLQVGRFLCPNGDGAVYYVVFFRVGLFSVFPFFLFPECYRYGQETAIFVQQFLQAGFFYELLAVIVHIKDDVCPTVGSFCFFEGKFGAAVARPFHGLGIVAVGPCDDFHFLCHHESRVKA